MASFVSRLATAGLVADPTTARIPVAVGSSTYEIEAHETAEGCLMRCDVVLPYGDLRRYAGAFSRLGRAEPGQTSVTVEAGRLTILRHLHEPAPDEMRSVAARLAAMARLAQDLAAALQAADVSEQALEVERPEARPPAPLPALPAEVPAHSESSVRSEPAAVPAGARVRRFMLLWSWWTVATSISFGVSAFVITRVNSPIALTVFALHWTVVAVAQVLVMNGFRHRIAWLPVTLLGGVISDLVLNADRANVSTPVYYAVAAAGGALMGLIQWAYLRGPAAGLRWWLVANLVAPPAQIFAISHVVTPLERFGSPVLTFVVAYLVSGAVFGLITGFALSIVRGGRSSPSRA